MSASARKPKMSRAAAQALKEEEMRIEREHQEKLRRE
jgi:hypothetical protein